MERMFEPFFTTKEPGHGTGLGLSMIYSFVQECGGFITFDSALGRGTTIRMFLKRSEPVEAGADLAISASCLSGRDHETILMVEDNVHVLQSTAEILRDLGYDVVEAATAAAALEILTSGRRIDVLFTDIAMPGGMSGRQLAMLARQIQPMLGVLYTSGYANRVLDGGNGMPHGEFLKKPYRDHELGTALRRILDGASRATRDLQAECRHGGDHEIPVTA
jgi:CheY-like chemotaxis protein